MKAEEVFAALKQAHGPNGREWAFFGEMRIGTGYMSSKVLRMGGFNPEQRLDAWAINLYPSKNLLRRTFEIKVSRSDFRHEIKHPEKRAAGLALSNEFYFVTPKDLVTVDEIPPECGLIYVHDGRVNQVKPAPLRLVEDPPLTFVASLARRAVEYQERWRAVTK